MHLNLAIIRKELDMECIRSHYVDAVHEFPCAYPLPFAPGSRCSKDAVYLCEGSAITEPVREAGVASIVVIGVPTALSLLYGVNYLCLNTDDDVAGLLAKVQLVFEKYYRWETALQHLTATRSPLSEYGRVSQPFIGNPFELVTSAHRILFFFPGRPKGEPTQEYRDYLRTYYDVRELGTTVETINYLTADKNYQQSRSQTEPQIYDSDHYDFRWLYQNIYEDGVYTAVLVFDEVIYPIEDYDRAIIKILSGFLQDAIKLLPPEDVYQPEMLVDVLAGLIDHRMLPEDRIDTALSYAGWRSDDKYLCMVIEALPESGVPQTMFLKNLLAQFQRCLFLFKDNALIVVFNVDDESKMASEHARRLMPLLRDCLYVVGESQCFDDFKKLYYFFLQARYALEVGRRKDPMLWSYRWKDYELDYFLHRAESELTVDAILPDGVRRLIAHDKGKEDGYVRLLRVYLDNDCNIAETSRVLYTHRNTCIYRIQRMTELLGLDLGDPDTKLILSICLRILDREDDSPTVPGVPATG